MTLARQAGDECNPYADAAMRYRRSGWGGPLPLPYSKKEKPPIGFTGEQAPYPTVEQIEEWSDAGRQNICLRLAGVDADHEIIGIDVDQYLKGNKQKRGFDQLQELVKTLGPLPDTWISSSRTDGKSGIRFYRVPRGLSFSGKVDDDVEVIRKGHRYAVVWPSIHPDGMAYRWFPPGHDPDDVNKDVWNGDLPNPRTFEKLPDPWIDFLTNNRTLASADLSDDKSRLDEIYNWADETFHGDDDTPPCGRMREKLNNHIVKVRDSSTFHDLLTNAHWNLFKLALEGHHGWVAAVNQYEQEWVKAVIARGGGTTDRSPETLRQEVFRSRSKALRKLKALDQPVLASCEIVGCVGDMANVISFPNLESAETMDQDDESLREWDIQRELYKIEIRTEAKQRFDRNTRAPFKRSVTNLTSFLAAPSNPTPMRIDSVMPDGGRVVFSAPYKAGKTTAVGNLIRSLVDGDPFLDSFAVNKPASRLVLIDNELSENMVRDWLLKQGIRNTDAVADVICLRGEVSTFDILNDQRRSEWAKWLRELGCDYLIFDCLRPVLDALGLDENHDAGKFLTAFDELLTEAKTCGDATIVHHMGHASERSRGDSRIQDWPDAIWKVVRESADDEFSPRYFSATGRDVEVPQGLLKYDPATRHLSYEGTNRTDAQKQRKVNTTVQEILKLLSDDLSNGGNGMKKGDLLNAVSSGRPAVEKALELGVSEGTLSAEKGPNNSTIYKMVTVISRGKK